ncbi:hypothetical protein ACQPTN_17050 [Bradyrhizobium sp. 13971]
MEIATEYNARKMLIDGAPRRRLVVQNLRGAAEATSNLVAALVALDDYSREQLLELSDLDRILPTLDLYEAAAANKLPRPETETEPAQDGLWIGKLRALERYLSWRLERFAGLDDDAPVDRGGKTNVVRDQFGAPAWFIVRYCWIIFENCRPGVATASEDGPFLRFVNHVHEYATGEIEENSTLHNWTKRLARPLRHHDQLLEKLGSHESELENLKADLPTPDGNARIAQLEAELPSLRKRVVDAYLALSHSNFRSKS